MLEVWLDYVRAHDYAWRMLFRDTGGGPRCARSASRCTREARAVLAGLIRHLAPAPLPERELEPLAELLSMGMASLVLWWIETPGLEREAVLDAIARVWTGCSRRAKAPPAPGSNTDRPVAPSSAITSYARLPPSAVDVERARVRRRCASRDACC